YTTFVVRVEAPFGASINFETDDVAWLPLDDVDRLPLHAGFASAWPELKEIARGAA
ncbi:MAG: NUDIX hydrolase, partial [Ilumatobacteraceae bacterium]